MSCMQILYYFELTLDKMREILHNNWLAKKEERRETTLFPKGIKLLALLKKMNKKPKNDTCIQNNY